MIGTKQRKGKASAFSIKMDKESYQWLKANNSPKKVTATISMQEQMVETRG